MPGASADAYTIAFGIRNVTHIDRALADAYRALAPGGRFMCLEFSRCDVPLLDAAYEFWSFKAIPKSARRWRATARPINILWKASAGFRISKHSRA